MSMRTSLLLLLCSATLMACFPDPPAGNAGGDPKGVFDPATFASQVMPALNGAGCLTGCHNATTGAIMGGFGLHPEAQAGSAQLDENVDLAAARVSATLSPAQAKQATLYAKATDGHGAGVKITDATALQNVENWIIVALGGEPVVGGGGGPDAGGGDGGGGGGNPDAFDAATFASTIQPIFDGNGCIGDCHNKTARYGMFALNPTPAVGSGLMEENRLAAVGKIDLTLAPDAAATAKLYMRATDTHSFTPVTDSAKQETLRSWIATGLMGQ